MADRRRIGNRPLPSPLLAFNENRPGGRAVRVAEDFALTSLTPTLPTYWLLAAAIAFLMKHLVADYLLQSRWMALGKERATNWLAPLAAHAGVHAALTGVLCLALAPPWIGLALVDFGAHFVVDRTKATLTRVFSADPSRGLFWKLLGLDQFCHHLTDLAFIVILTSAHTAA
jgi:hypothetical protein